MVAAVPAAAVMMAAADSNCGWWLWTVAVDNDYGTRQRQSLWAEVRLAASRQWAGGTRVQMVSGLYCAIDDFFRLLFW